MSVYLGDGVYAHFDGFHIWIWTSDGIHNSEKIALDDHTFDSLISFGMRCFEMDGKTVKEWIQTHLKDDDGG